MLASTLLFAEMLTVKIWFFHDSFFSSQCCPFFYHCIKYNLNINCSVWIIIRFNCVCFLWPACSIHGSQLRFRIYFLKWCHTAYGGSTNSFSLFCAADCLGRRLGPRFLGRVDDSGVRTFPWHLNFILISVDGNLQLFFYIYNAYVINLCWILAVVVMVQQRLVRDFYKILNQVNAEEIPHGLKLPASFSQLVSDMKNNQYDARTFAFMLRAMVCFTWRI